MSSGLTMSQRPYVRPFSILLLGLLVVATTGLRSVIKRAEKTLNPNDGKTWCVAESCGYALGGASDSGEDLIDAIEQDDNLCQSAFKIVNAAEKEGRQIETLVRVEEASCLNKRESLHLHQFMFNAHLCEAGDLCLQAASRLASWLVACPESAQGFTSMDVAEPYHRQSIAPAYCEEYHSTESTHATEDLLASLRCPCKRLSGTASRSGANIQRTADGLHIVKEIKASETPTALQIWNRIPSNTLLNTWLYLDPVRNLVIMPNAFKTETFQLHADLFSPPGSACAYELPVVDIQSTHGFDVKPLPIKAESASQRAPFLVHLIKRQLKLKHFSGWAQVSASLTDTLDMLQDPGLKSGNSLVDYSLMFAFFDAHASASDTCSPKMEFKRSAEREVHCITQRSCESGHNTRATRPMDIPRTNENLLASLTEPIFEVGGPPNQDYFADFGGRREHQPLVEQNRTQEDPPELAEEAFEEERFPGPISSLGVTEVSCEAVCMTVIDYFMEFGWKRWAESKAKSSRWNDYQQKVWHLWECAGDLQAEGCYPYLKIGCDALLDAGEMLGNGNVPWCDDYMEERRRYMQELDDFLGGEW